MKAICVLIGAFVACSMAASAASIEQVLDISVLGWYQGPTNIVGASEHDRVIPVRIGSDNIVHSLAVDRDTNFYRGTLIYKTALDGSTTNIVIRKLGRTNELDVTDAFSFLPDIFVADQLFRTNATAPVTNSYVETGLRAVMFNSSNVAFSTGFSVGTSTRTRKLSANIHGTVVSGYANVLNYTGGGGAFLLNTNAFYLTNFQFAATNYVVGPAQIQHFKTFNPVIWPD